MEYILAIGAVYLLAEQNSQNMAARIRYLEQSYTSDSNSSGGPPLDPTGYYRDDHLEGRRVFGEQIDKRTAMSIGASTATADHYNRWTNADPGAFAPRLHERRQFTEDFVKDVPHGWDRWWEAILRAARRHERGTADPFTT